jgi:hypothetical protein
MKVYKESRAKDISQASTSVQEQYERLLGEHNARELFGDTEN